MGSKSAGANRFHSAGKWMAAAIIVAAACLGLRVSAARMEQPARLTGPALLFEENRAQFSAGVYFQVQSEHGLIRLADDGIWWLVSGRDTAGATAATQLHLQFVGGSWSRPEPFDSADVTVSYLTPSGMIPSVPAWHGVRYRDLFPGVDLELSGYDGRFTWQLIRRQDAPPMVSVPDIVLSVAGSDGVQLSDAELLATTPLGVHNLPLPGAPAPLRLIVTSPAGEADEIPSALLEMTSQSHSPSATELVYSTYIGGDSEDQGNDIYFAADGYAYAIGEYWSVDSFPLEAGLLIPLHDIDSYVAKMRPDGSGFVYLFHIRASQEEAANGIAVDGAGNAYVGGRSSSPDFPTTSGAYDNSPNGLGDGWLVKVNSAGTGVIFSTMLGKTLREWIWDVALDGSGNILVTGQTESANFPVTGDAFDNTFNGDMDAFVSKLSNNGSVLLYSSFLGTGAEDIGEAIAVDNAGAVYVSGVTRGENSFPRTSAFGALGNNDAFVTKFAGNGGVLIYSALIGGSSIEHPFGVAVDAANRAVVSGVTYSGDFPATAGAYDATPNGGADAFALRLSAAGSTLEYATYLGGSGNDEGRRVALDANQRAYLTGSTSSTNFPVTSNAYDVAANGGLDLFVAQLSVNGDGLLYGSYVGGSGNDAGRGIAIAGVDKVLLTGLSWSPNFPISPGAFDSSLNGLNDVVVLSLDWAVQGPPTPTPPFRESLPAMLNGG